ncbi:MAG TPA: hypothetical protein VLA72_12515 [Anaerolineales bacterium]|nr:hypothetical protein [Anaerolineales bacterium]
MTRSKFIRAAGLALIAGAVLFALSGTAQQIMGFVPSLLFLAIGILGLRSRYGEKAGGFGKNILLIGVILGALTSLTGFIIPRDPYWILIAAGPAVLLACLALFGVVALFRKPMTRWNALPLLAGVWIPILFVPVITEVFSGNYYPDVGNLAMPLIGLQCIALSILGFVLISDTPDESAVAA